MQKKPVKVRVAHGRYLRVPSWASLEMRVLAAPDSSASTVSIEIEKHRPIPVREPIVPEEAHGGASADGLLIDSAEAPAAGALVELRIRFQPDDPPIGMRGEVVEARACGDEPGRYHVKIGFIAGTEDEVDTIAQFVKKYYG